MLSIAEVKKKDINSNVNLKGTILQVGNQEQPSTGNTKSRIYCIIADETASISTTVYGSGNQSKFQKGAGIVLINALIKDSFLAITSKTDVGVAKPIDIPDEIRQSAPQLFQTAGEELIMSAALASPEKTLVAVKGKIMKISPASTRPTGSNRENIPYQELTLKDKSGAGIVAIWNDNVDRFSPGQKIKLSSCRVRLFQQKKRLTTTANCQTELFSHSDDLDDLSSEDELGEDEPAGTGSSGAITAVFETDPYLACIRPSCNNKKLITELQDEKYIMVCPTCNQKLTASSANWYCRMTVMFTSETENSSRKMTIFKPEIQKIFQSKNKEVEVGLDREELQAEMVSILPLEIKCLVKNNTLQNIVCKRSATN